MTVQQIIDAILDYSTVPQKIEPTCDRLMAGSPETPVRGVVTTFMATIGVIREAAALGANLIITHEPTWWSGADDVQWLQNDPLYRDKQGLIEKNNIAIWRYHDHMHVHKPDAIYTGLLKQLDWEKYRRLSTLEPSDFIASFGDYYDIPETTLSRLADFFKEKLNMKTVRIIGEREMPCSRIGILVGGGSLGLGVETMPAEVMQAHDIHVMVCGDITEWTLPAYVNDAAQLGHKRALLIVGHERTEEWGMKYMAEWLPSLINNVPVNFVDAREPFDYL